MIAAEARADPSSGRDPSSWRDPSGFVYRRDGTLYRQVNRVALEEWTALETSGFLAGLQADGLLIPHENVGLDLAADPSIAVAVIRPERVPFVSYPYEWTLRAAQGRGPADARHPAAGRRRRVHPARRERLQRPVPRAAGRS